jgi:hypothetical protein
MTKKVIDPNYPPIVFQAGEVYKAKLAFGLFTPDTTIMIQKGDIITVLSKPKIRAGMKRFMLCYHGGYVSGAYWINSPMDTATSLFLEKVEC